MVPTEEARITLQIPYSAVPPMGIASARLAMLPPVEFDPGYWGVAQSRRPAGEAADTPLRHCPPLALESPLLTRGKGCEPGLQWRRGSGTPPVIYVSAFVVKK